MESTFKKQNYILLVIGLIFILSGLALMIGGGAEDPAKFSYKIFNLQRLTFAPILIAIGFIIEVFAIMIRSQK